MTVISFRYDHSHDQRYQLGVFATGCSATRISLASSSCFTPPGCLSSLCCFTGFHRVVFDLPTCLALAVYLYLVVLLDSITAFGCFKWNHAVVLSHTPDNGQD